MAENVRVVVRCRPMNQKERITNCKDIVEIENGTVNLKNPNDKLAPSKNFKFDNTYDTNSTTEALYNDICYALVENVLEGYNGTIFAYGQTGCGKSHTMQGEINTNQIQQIDNVTAKNIICDNNTNNNNNNTNINSGIIPRSFDHIFEAISVASAKRYLVLVSYLEIYNETIRDLLKSSSSTNSFDIGTSGLQLKEIPGEGIIVTNLSTHTVHNAKECDELLKIGAKNRIVGSTLMNANSSRSHSIFTISLEQIDSELVNQIENDLNNENEINSNQKQNDYNNSITIKKGKLNLVDLAGSERQNKTGASGDRLKEATKINLSLSALGNVISALVDGKTKHIPYRDSKLTRLLQDSLGGNTKTLMIACISPADYNYDETLSTLRYANRAKNIHNQPKINEDPKDAKLREYQEEINKLRKLLESNHLNEQISNNEDNNNNNITILNNNNQKSIENEKEKLKAEYEAEANRLRKEYELQQKEKEEIIRDMELLKSHYKNQLKDLQYNTAINNNDSTTLMLNDTTNTINNINANKTISTNEITQQEALNRIEIIKNALIGGERSNDIELKENRHRKKIAAQRRLSALAYALSRVEQSSDRDLLQEHYSDIQQELKIKNDTLKSSRQQIKALEREVTDLQSEFQLDRADYLETIRRLEKNLKFYQQLFEKALPILRKDGKYWDPVQIQSEAVWNDDLQIWKLPEYNMTHLKLPPPTISMNSEQPMVFTIQNGEDENDVDTDICKSYFRPRRSAAHYNQQSKGSKSWKDITKKNLKNLQQNVTVGSDKTDSNSNNWLNFNQINKNDENNSVLASWLPANHISVSKTWYDLSRLSAKSSSSSSYWNKNNNIRNNIKRDSISSPSMINNDNYKNDSKINQRQYTSDSEDLDIIIQKNKHIRSPKFF